MARLPLLHLLLFLSLVLLTRTASHYALLQQYRPPLQTVAQSALAQTISAQAPYLSEEARETVRDYMGVNRTRFFLDPSLQRLSDEELLERFTWEFKHLPIIHNSASTLGDANNAILNDETILSITLANGYIQNVCQRYVFGGPELPSSVAIYAHWFHEYVGMPRYNQSRWTTSQANECLLFNANNLRKTSYGNVYYGGVTWVLNRQRVQGRLIFDPWDLGNINYYAQQGNYTAKARLGTLEHFYHLVMAHEYYMNRPFPPEWYMPPWIPCCDYSIADLFNRWWVPGTAVPTQGMLATNPYYEALTLGTVHVPEDISYVIATFANKSSNWPNQAYQGMWGTALGGALQQHLRLAGRPLVWASFNASPMLLDPTVGGVVGVTPSTRDVQVWQSFWSSGRTPTNGMFVELAANLSPSLHLSYLSWPTRAVCEEVEKDERNVIVGVNGEGLCIYWAMKELDRWECMNDGSCGRSGGYGARATFPTKQQCMEQCASLAWTCASNITGDPNGHTQYCTPRRAADDQLRENAARFASLSECESECYTGL